MRISLVTETFFPQVNGVSRSLGRLVQYLVAAGDEVHLLIPRYPPSEDDSRAGVKRVDAFRSVPLPFYPEVLLPLATPRMVRRRLAAFRPDIVHVATEGPLGWAAVRAARGMHLPLVTSYHTNFSHYTTCYRLGLFSRLLWRYLRRFHNAGLATFCPTESIRNILEENRFNNIIVWGRGVDGELFHPRRREAALRRQFGADGVGDCLLVCAGRLAPEKNLDVLVDAVAGMPADANVRLVLIGDGPSRDALQRRADGRVVFAGYRRGEALAAAVASADLMVFPSLSETFGNVVLEAMACGLPVVAFDAPGPRDVIRDGRTGRVVAPATAEALRQATLELVRDHARREAMGREALAFARAQTWDSVLAVVRDTYRRVLS